jgi:hypothetical protein
MSVFLAVLIACGSILLSGCAGVKQIDPSAMIQKSADDAVRVAVETSQETVDALRSEVVNDLGDIEYSIAGRLDKMEQKVNSVAEIKSKPAIETVTKRVVQKVVEKYDDEALWNHIDGITMEIAAHSDRVASTMALARKTKDQIEDVNRLLNALQDAQGDASLKGAAGGAGIAGFFALLLYALRRMSKEFR